MLLEGGQMLLATILMTIWHPGRFMHGEWKKQKNVGKEVEDGRKFSVGSGSTAASARYPAGRPGNAAAFNQQPTQSQWPMHQVPLK